MIFKQQLKKLLLKSPFSWPVIAYNSIREHEQNSVKKGSDAYIQSLRNRPWFNDDPDNRKRYQYDLNANSIVFDIGGYEGEYASILSNKYNCSIFIFEPIPAFFQIIKNKFSHNDKIHTFCFGLAGTTSEQQISLSANASSIFIKKGKSMPIQLKSIVEFLQEEQIPIVDLVKINIEGAEYDLLESLIESGKITSFKNIQVQFHDFVIPNAKERMNQIQHDLEKTHFLTYSYEFVWENWQLKTP